MLFRLSKSVFATLAVAAGLSLAASAAPVAPDGGSASNAAAGLLFPSDASAALSMPGPTPDPVPGIVGDVDLKRILPIARKELRKRVRERRGNNIPRYRNGKGRIAPYSIRDQWCVAFGTWVWQRAGFLDYLGTDLIWRSWDGTDVAVQVTDLSNWAKRTAHWSARAKPGYLVAYDFSHIGVVERVDRDGRAVKAIEGNKSDRVRRVNVPMANVTGYISPTELSTGEILRSIARPDMVVPAAMATDTMSQAVSSP